MVDDISVDCHFEHDQIAACRILILCCVLSAGASLPRAGLQPRFLDVDPSPASPAAWRRGQLSRTPVGLRPISARHETSPHVSIRF